MKKSVGKKMEHIGYMMTDMDSGFGVEENTAVYTVSCSGDGVTVECFKQDGTITRIPAEKIDLAWMHEALNESPFVRYPLMGSSATDMLLVFAKNRATYVLSQSRYREKMHAKLVKNARLMATNPLIARALAGF